MKILQMFQNKILLQFNLTKKSFIITWKYNFEEFCNNSLVAPSIYVVLFVGELGCILLCIVKINVSTYAKNAFLKNFLKTALSRLEMVEDISKNGCSSRS